MRVFPRTFCKDALIRAKGLFLSLFLEVVNFAGEEGVQGGAEGGGRGENTSLTLVS
jgi:hypothetical protein